MNARLQAVRVLEQIEQRGSFADRLLGGVENREDAFLRTLVMGVLRWRGQLDHLIEQLASRKLSRIQPKVLQLLRVGMVQLRFMDVPPHAALSETIEAARSEATRAGGFINAVLRAATRTNLDDLLPRHDDAESLAIRYSHPLWMVRRWLEKVGPTRCIQILESNQTLSYPDLLVNTPRHSLEQVQRQLQEVGIEAITSTLVPGVLRLRQSSSAAADLIEQGWVYPMDEGSALVASLIPADCSRVLDVAAAPGGKSLVLRRNGVKVVSNDLSMRRLLPLRRFHFRFFGDAPAIVAGDGRFLPFRRRFPALLLDAPCSATGIIRKHPEIKWRLQLEDLPTFAATQKELLIAALDTANLCLYATCSLEPEENDEVVNAVLAERSDFELADLGEHASDAVKPWIEDGVLRLTPDSGCDGFTAHALRRR